MVMIKGFKREPEDFKVNFQSLKENPSQQIPPKIRYGFMETIFV